MSFTSQVVRVGEGWDQKDHLEQDSFQVYSIHNNSASSVGAQGSGDDPQAYFTDTFVDMAKNVTEEMEQESRGSDDQEYYEKKHKNKKKIYN